MRIAILMSVVSPWSLMIVKELAAAGHDVYVSYPSSSGDPETDDRQGAILDGIAKARLPLPSDAIFGRLSQARSLGRWCQNMNCDVLVTLYGGWFAVLAWLSGFRPFAVYVVGSDILLAKGLKRHLLGHVLTKAKRVFANGSALAEETRSASGRDDIIALYHGIETGPDPLSIARPETIEIICSRWFEPIYNNEMLIRAAALLPTNLPAYKLTFLAGGSLLNEAVGLADRILHPEVRANVEFLGGVEHQALLERYRNAHIYVSVSNSDGTSTSLLEAFACGLFPVVTDIPANTEWIRGDLSTGLVVPCGDAPALARALERAIRDAELRRLGARLNRQAVVDQADIHANMAKMVRLLS
jgi:glycosyltransferase involved in cell wall biosynthesis